MVEPWIQQPKKKKKMNSSNGSSLLSALHAMGNQQTTTRTLTSPQPAYKLTSGASSERSLARPLIPIAYVVCLLLFAVVDGFRFVVFFRSNDRLIDFWCTVCCFLGQRIFFMQRRRYSAGAVLYKMRRRMY